MDDKSTKDFLFGVALLEQWLKENGEPNQRIVIDMEGATIEKTEYCCVCDEWDDNDEDDVDDIDDIDDIDYDEEDEDE